jgi:hypothetical protein
MTDLNYNKLIQDKVAEGEALVQKIKDQIEELAEVGRTTAYWGEYGSGETYYSVGYVQDNIDSDGEVDYLNFEDEYEPGSWISSSSIC